VRAGWRCSTARLGSWPLIPLLASGLACGGTAEPAAPVVASVVVNPATDTLVALGATRQLTATALDAAGNAVAGVTLAWSSSVPAVASVNASGLVAAVGNGQSQITASASGITGSATVTVAQNVATVSVTPATATLTSLGATQQFTATARDANSNTVAGVKFLWVSSDHAVATVDTNGLATARRSGLITITAAGGGVPGNAALGVTQTATRLAYRVPPPASTVAGEAFGTAVQVEIRDDSGAVVPDAQLPVTLTSSGALLHGTATVNAINGVASFSGLWMETAGSGYTLSATSGALAAAVSPPLAITPAPRVAVAYVNPPVTDSAGAHLAVVARLRDRFGNTDTAATDTVRARLVLNAPGGALFGDTVAAAVGGVASFPALSLHLAGAGYALSASARGLDSAVSDTFGVTPASGHHLTFYDSYLSTQANTPSASFDVAVRDTFENLVDVPHDVTVSLARVPWPPAAVQGTATQASVSGIATFPDIGVDRPANQAPNNYLLKAAGPGLIADSVELFVPMFANGVAAGGDHTCASALSGQSLFCWGANGAGQIGNPAIPLTGDSAPALVGGGLGLVDWFGAGTAHTCALDAGGDAFCWGANDQGQLGTGAAGAGSATPVAVAGGHTWRGLAVGGSHACGIRGSDSTAYCWGDNSQGQLGDDASPTDQPAPAAVYGGRRYWSITAGQEHSCAIAVADSTAYCWGRGDLGQLGQGAFTSSDTAVVVSGGDKWVALSAGDGFTCGVQYPGPVGSNIFCWGRNDLGQLGSNTAPTNRALPDTVVGALAVSQPGTPKRRLSAGGSHACALARTAASAVFNVWCWGDNASGQLGPDGGASSAIPVEAMSGLTRTFGEVAAGLRHSCVRVSGAQTGYQTGLYCWGRNAEGQLGIGSTTGTSTPTRTVQ
jgi:hypothetical protein